MEFSQILALCALGLGFFNALYGIVIRSQTTDKDFRKELQDLRDRMLVFEVRSKPTWDALERRLADILHQPTHLALDQLLERISSSGVDGLSDEELVHAIARVSHWEYEVRPGGAHENPMQRLAATLMLASLKGHAAERQHRRQEQWSHDDTTGSQPWWQRWWDTSRAWGRRWMSR